MKSLSDLWDSILARLSGELSDMTIKTWFDEITVVTMEDSALVLHCSNPFKKNTVEARFLPHIKAALKDIFSTDLEVKILSDEQLAAYHGVAPDRPGNLFDSDAFTFETYVVGPQNKLAYAAAKAVAEKPAEGFNPLFIYGESGLGKTHLLYAIAHLMRSRRPESRIVYIKGDDFTNELVSSIRENRNAEFREKYRQADILLVDDIQFIAGKASTQEEFFHTFDALHKAQKQIVLTSDRPPKDMEVLNDRLRTRFEWGLIADIQAPDIETRMAIIQRKAQTLGLELPLDVVEHISEKIKTNVRQLEGVVKKINALVNLEGSAINIAMVESAMRDFVSDSRPVGVIVDKIIEETGRTFGVAAEDISSMKRDAKTAKARQVAVYAVREVTGLTQEEIGVFFGGRDRTTILYSYDKVAEAVARDPAMRKTVENIMKNVREGKTTIQ